MSIKVAGDPEVQGEDQELHQEGVAAEERVRTREVRQVTGRERTDQALQEDTEVIPDHSEINLALQAKEEPTSTPKDQEKAKTLLATKPAAGHPDQRAPTTPKQKQQQLTKCKATSRINYPRTKDKKQLEIQM